MNVANLCYYLIARAKADTATGGLYHASAPIVTGVYVGVAPPKAALPYVVISLPDASNMETFTQPNWETTIRFAAYAKLDAPGEASSALQVLSNVIDRLVGDWEQQEDRQPTYGYHRHVLQLTPELTIGGYQGSAMVLVNTSLQADDERVLQAVLEFKTFYSRELQLIADP